VSSRREARRSAIEVLYRCDLTGADPDEVVAEWRAAGREIAPFTERLVAGVRRRLPEIDRSLEAHAEGWTVARMATLDRTILRVAVFELLEGDDVPPSVAISEAVEAASELSAEEAPGFVNGILGRIEREREASASGEAQASGVEPGAGS
jgi:N utilization substance protein B